MTAPKFDDLFSRLSGLADEGPLFSAERRGGDRVDARPYRERRAECESAGHRYQVLGSKRPTALTCKRCLVRWAVGPRTEPREASS